MKGGGTPRNSSYLSSEASSIFILNAKEDKFLVSACLAGINCTYNGKSNLDSYVKTLSDNSQALALCAEVLGGLAVPRENAEIVGGDGNDVWSGRARVLTAFGKDVSKNFRAGARKVISLTKRHKITRAILKSKSPCCGSGRIYDGTFKKVLRKGDGVLASLLRRRGIKIYTEEDWRR